MYQFYPDLICTGAHVSHLEHVDEEELNRLLRIVVDVENLFMCVHREEDAETKQVYFYLFKVSFAFLKSKNVCVSVCVFMCMWKIM